MGRPGAPPSGVSKVTFFRADRWGRYECYKEIETLPAFRGADLLEMAAQVANPGDLVRYDRGGYFEFTGESLKAVTGRKLRSLIVL